MGGMGPEGHGGRWEEVVKRQVVEAGGEGGRKGGPTPGASPLSPPPPFTPPTPASPPSP